MIKRQRGRGRNPGQKPQNNNPNRAYESNGPDLKVRGSAQTVFEKYQQLGRDCQSNGDRVLGENYMQHAEHYFRVLRAMQPTFVPRTELMIAGYDDEEYESDENGAVSGGEGEAAEPSNGGPQPEFQQNRPPRENRDRDNRDRDRNNNRDRDNNRPPREFRDNREPRENREPRDQNDMRSNEPRDHEPRNNEPRVDGEEGRYGRRRRRPDRPERFGNEGGAPNQGEGQNDQGQRDQGPRDQGQREEGRFEGRREPRGEPRGENRSDYRGESEQPSTAIVETPVSFNQPEFAQPSSFSDPQEISVPSEAPAPRARPPRPPRAPRAPRAPREAPPSGEETGFGNEMPAFLAAPVPVASGD